MTTHAHAVDARRDVEATGDCGRARAVLAVKDLARAKSRLAADLATEDREGLVLAMFADTIGAVRRARCVGRIVVVTPDTRIADVARRAGALVFPDPPTPSSEETGDDGDDGLGPTGFRGDATLNAAYRRAATAVGLSTAPVIALQADLPALTPEEFDAAIARAPQGRSVVIDHTGRGTTALIVRGHDLALEPMFGPDSARRHVRSGAIPLTGAAWPGLRTDVDTLADLRRVIDIGVGQHTRQFLERRGHAARSN